MNYGMYISASSVSVNMARQDLLSNNLANVNTVGFKPDVFMIRQRDAARIEDRIPFVNSDRLLEKLGAGVMPLPTQIDLDAGSLDQSGNPLDVAIEGEGFMAVLSGGEVRLTRDGRMAMRADGRLVNAASGAQMLDEENQPIMLDPAQSVRIDADGAIIQGDAEIARLQLVNVTQPSRLIKDGNNLLKAAQGESFERRPASGTLVQGYVENSAVDSIRAMIGVTSASQAAQAGLSTIGAINELMGRAITLGRVTG
jgi:flagellar basal body rod protein FlgG